LGEPLQRTWAPDCSLRKVGNTRRLAMASSLKQPSGSLMIRRACVLAGLLTLFMQGSSGGHMLLVEHTRCAEHGELVHDGDAHRHVAGEHAHADSTSVHGTPDASSGEAHDHCALSIDRRDAFVSICTPARSTHALETPHASAPTDAFVVARTARFRIAPKNSPPA